PTRTFLDLDQPLPFRQPDRISKNPAERGAAPTCACHFWMARLTKSATRLKASRSIARGTMADSAYVGELARNGTLDRRMLPSDACGSSMPNPRKLMPPSRNTA